VPMGLVVLCAERYGMRRSGAWAQRQRHQRLQHGAALMKRGRVVSSAQAAPCQGRVVLALAKAAWCLPWLCAPPGTWHRCRVALMRLFICALVSQQCAAVDASPSHSCTAQRAAARVGLQRPQQGPDGLLHLQRV